MRKCKYLIFLITPLLVISCKINKETVLEEKYRDTFFVGTYTTNKSKGIYKYALDASGKFKKIGLSVETNNPSFLAKSNNGNFLVAVDEVDKGYIKSYLIEKDTLKLISKVSSKGAYPCFVAANDYNYVVTANYGTGNISLYKLKANGQLTEALDVQQHSGKGITSRQEGPHAHSAYFINSNQIVSIDLGTNELWFYAIDKGTNKLKVAKERLKMADGAGPRHMAFHPNGKWSYVINELNSTVSLLDNSAGVFKLKSSTSTLPEGFGGKSTCADIRISQDGKFLYASNRGHDSIVVFQINETTGKLLHLGFQSTLGEIPRNFSLSPDDKFLIVANQRTNSLVSFSRNAKTGMLVFADKVGVPTPVCILF